MVMDGAGWHKSKGLVVPENIEIIIMPPYSPELNPIERLWKYIKQNTIKNRLFETISYLEEYVSHFIRTITYKVIASVCQITYL